MEHTKKSGIVAIIGRPSAGKSTLLNSLAGAKVSIVSPVPQTTRNAIRGIVNRPKGQLVFIDTPGYHDSDKKLNLLLKGIAKDRLPEADCILYLIDASREAGPEEASIIQLLAKSADKLVIGINKIDRQDARPDMVRLFLEKELPGVSHDRIVELSAGTGKNTGVLLDAVYSVVPEGEAMYPEEYYTDQDVDFRIAEIIREKAILNTRQEIPHALYVEIADMEMKRNGKELWVRAFIVVERETQKAMIIGKGASMIKKITHRSQRRNEKNIRLLYPAGLAGPGAQELAPKGSRSWQAHEAVTALPLFHRSVCMGNIDCWTDFREKSVFNNPGNTVYRFF